MSPRNLYATKRGDGSLGWLAPANRGESVVLPPEPPAPTGTVFGYNTLDGEGAIKMARWGKVPMARIFNNASFLSTDGSYFAPGGICYRGAGLGRAGVTSGRRLNMSIIYSPASVTTANSAKCNEFRNFAAAIPAGWVVQMVMYHEYNLHTTGKDGEAGSLADFRRSHKLLAQAIVDGDDGRGRAIPVINTSEDAGSLSDGEIVAADEMPTSTEWHNDAYDNPRGQPPGYKRYGTTYNNEVPLQSTYARAVRLGYTQPGYGWGIDEFNAPRRVAPKLATLDTSLGWGPLTPYDISGAGQANSISRNADFALGCAVPPSTMLLFVAPGNLWNQRFTSAGSAGGDAPVGSPHRQGWPIDTDPSLPYAAWQKYLDRSA